MDGPLLECVPNVSEGRDQQILDDLAGLISLQPDVKLLHVDRGYDANRTVFTFVGSPSGVVDAAFAMMSFCQEKLDMRSHEGSHSRIGAVDVCPLVPVSGISMAETVEWAMKLGQRVGRELRLPVYMYESAAQRAERKNLATIRKGEYEGLAEKMKKDNWQPDFGPVAPSAKFGATVIGARSFLVAFNINLRADTPLKVAKRIAGILRESGIKGQRGLIKGLKAIGWHQPEFGCCQVSTNVVEPQLVNLAHLYRSCTRLARASGYDTTGSELIGLIPETYLLAAGRVVCPSSSSDRAIACGIDYLGLNALEKFDVNERVLEYLL